MIYLDNDSTVQSIYIPRSSVRTDASPEYATKTELENAIENEVIRADGKYATKTDLLPYATTGWVESQDYVNSDEMASAITDAITSETARTEETYQKISEMSAYSTTNEVESMIDDAVSGKMDTSAMSAYSTTQEMNQAIDASAAYTTGWVASQGYLTGFTETDPIFTGSPAYGITSQDITNWNSVSGKADASKFNDYTPSSGFSTINGSAITSGEAIVIETGGNYSAGTNIQIEDNVISVTGITVPTKLSDLDNDEGFITNEALSGKVDTSAMTSYYTSGETDTAINNAVSGKQDTLVNQVNIKSINGTSLLGSGNIQISEGGTYTGGDNIEITPQNVINVTGITSYTGITSGDVVTALGFTPISGVDLSDYYTSEQTNTAIDNATSGKLDYSAYTAYTASTLTELGNKQDASAMTAYYTSGETNTAINNATSGKADSSAVTADIAAATAATTGWVSEQGYLTAFTESDPVFMASPASGITSQNITDWNSVSGKVDTSALTQYYTSAETNTAINNAVSGKADTSRVDEIEEVASSAITDLNSKIVELSGNSVTTGTVESMITAATSGFATTSAITDVENHILNFEEQTADALLNLNSRVNDAYSEFDGINEHIDSFEEETAIALVNLNGRVNSKQDTLVSGTNIKTINNESLLGSGNIVISGGGDMSQYWTSAETQSAITNSVSGKADTSAVTAAISAATADMVTGDRLSGVIHIEVLDQQAYDNLVGLGEIDPNTLYIII